MQRFSSMVTLILFMFMLSWVAQVFQQDPLPFRTKPRNGSPDNQTSETRQEFTPQRVSLPHRNGDSLGEPDAPESITEMEKSAQDNPLPSILSPTAEAKHHSPQYTENCIHFLLLGRAWDNNTVQFVMVVTLTRGSHSRLTAIDPAFPVELEGAATPLGELLQKGGGYDDLCRFTAEITGLEPQFFIDLNIYGFLEMLDLLGGINYGVYSTLAGAVPSTKLSTDDLGGAEVLRLLTDPYMSTAEKELMVVALLITARDIQHTKLGLSLLWTGYRNIKTNLGLNDLLELRRVTQGISPTRVSFREIRLPGP